MSATTTPTSTAANETADDRKMNVIGLAFGALFGGLLAGGLLHEYDTIHNTLVLEDLYVFFVMGSAVAIATPVLWYLERRGTATAVAGPLKLSRPKPERHHVTGGLLFGTGWAVAGTCPAPALVMLSSGAWLAGVAIGGIFLGLYLREVQTRDLAADGDGDGEKRSVPIVARFGR